MTSDPGGWRDLAEASLRDAIAAAAQTIDRGLDPVVRAAAAIRDAVSAGGKVLVFGNGGSAAEAQHFAAEMMGRFARERAAMAAVALTTDTSVLTAVANDYAFDRVFARQVEGLGRPGDVALGISTSGRSSNVVEALRVARARGLVTIGLTGGDGGPMGAAVDVHVNVPHRAAARIQEVQLMLLHAICALVEGAEAAGAD
jgi:D-sedoheptulose 7-phosphate isomerase